MISPPKFIEESVDVFFSTSSSLILFLNSPSDLPVLKKQNEIWRYWTYPDTEEAAFFSHLNGIGRFIQAGSEAGGTITEQKKTQALYNIIRTK